MCYKIAIFYLYVLHLDLYIWNLDRPDFGRDLVFLNLEFGYI